MRYNVIFVGSVSVGKTSLIHRYLKKFHNRDVSSTLAVDYHPIKIDDISLSLWDTAGQERFHSITSSYFSRGHIFVLVHDIENGQVKKDMETWYKQIFEKCPARHEPVIIIVSNKTDLHPFCSQEVTNWIQDHSFDHVFTSAVTGEGMEKLFQKNRQEQTRELKELWIKEMLTTQSPFTEHMTLFWHNHFVSEFKKVKWAGYMYQQNKLLRKHALGSFAVLLREISTNPALLIYLGGNKNRKGKANENFAREVLELFSLGEGRVYSEADIQNAARAFSGWSVDKKKAQFVNRTKQHDNGHKEFLGQSGNFNGDDIIDIPVMKKVVLGIAPSDAHQLVIDCANHVTQSKGGDGVARETAEFILSNAGLSLIEMYSGLIGDITQ